jgi:hypothetical protein
LQRRDEKTITQSSASVSLILSRLFADWVSQFVGARPFMSALTGASHKDKQPSPNRGAQSGHHSSSVGRRREVMERESIVMMRSSEKFAMRT